MSELWLTAGHIEDVAETSKSQETSFVLGWPTTNVVATFMYVIVSFFLYTPSLHLPLVSRLCFQAKRILFLFLETRNKLD